MPGLSQSASSSGVGVAAAPWTKTLAPLFTRATASAGETAAFFQFGSMGGG